MHMDELKAMKIWVCLIITDKNGKLDKKPISAYGTETGSDEAHAHTWVTYDEAVKAMNEKCYSAVAFTVPKNMAFMDLDHKELTDPFVQLQLERFNTYAERSISGTGIHIYCLVDTAKIPTYTKDGELKLDRAFYQKNTKKDIELYLGAVTNRFATFTGDVINDEPINDCTDALLVTLDKDMRRDRKVEYSDKRDGDRELFDIVCNLRKQKNGDKFSKLYDNGDFSDYGSQSEADCALCAMIAFRTGADMELIDTVFRSSALYREKWERDDYREATIERGIEACNGVFHISKMEHPEFIRFREKSGKPYVSEQLLAKYVREHLTYLLIRDNGKQSVQRYVYEDGVYKLYASDMFKGCIKRFVEEYDAELVKMGQINEVYQHIMTDLDYSTQDELNADETLINFKNGILKVTDNSLLKLSHTPDVYSTIQIPCSWTGSPSPTPVFDAYMQTLTNGDKDIEQLLMEFIGVCISNVKGWRMKKALFLVGDGDTGKSQLKSLVERLLGKDNFIGIDLKEIEARFGTGAIYGTRLAGSSDMSFLSVDELKTFKKITGGDSLYAELKGQQAFEFTYNGLLWFCMNRLPRFGGDNGQWVYDRIMVIRCDNAIPKDKQDKLLLDKLYAERDGIVYKAVKALQRVIANGYYFSEPDSVTEAREKYQTENSTVISFFNECMCPWKYGKINRHCTTGRVYRVYKAWCQDNNNGFSKTAREFRDDLSAYLGGTYADITTRQKGNTYYRDYTITDEAKEQFSKEYGYDCSEFL